MERNPYIQSERIRDRTIDIVSMCLPLLLKARRRQLRARLQEDRDQLHGPQIKGYSTHSGSGKFL